MKQIFTTVKKKLKPKYHCIIPKTSRCSQLKKAKQQSSFLLEVIDLKANSDKGCNQLSLELEVLK